ncbi:MAG: hypothetical protein JWQ03_2487 [Variovorax sp.]|nr:hypothetical protein [Variovorax sp.]
MRDAVEAHRTAKREQVLREEAWTGRHLTPAELAELRRQVRQQWAGYSDHSPAAPLPPVEHPMSPPSVVGESSTGKLWPIRSPRP